MILYWIAFWGLIIGWIIRAVFGGIKEDLEKFRHWRAGTKPAEPIDEREEWEKKIDNDIHIEDKMTDDEWIESETGFSKDDFGFDNIKDTYNL